MREEGRLLSDERHFELYKRRSDALEKYIYFLLAAAGACIAFATTKTDNAPLRKIDLLWVLALLSWASSFYYGCRFLQETERALRANFALLKLESMSSDSKAPPAQSPRKDTSSDERSISTLFETQGRRLEHQFRLMLVGAGFFVAWHIVQMYLRTG